MLTQEQIIEQFSTTNPETGEMEVDRVALKKHYIESGVRLKHEQSTLAEDLKALLEETKENGFDKKEMKALIDNSFKDEIAEKIAELEKLQTELNNLFGGEDEQ